MALVTETTNVLIEQARHGGISYAEAIRAVGEQIARMSGSAIAARANEKQLDVIRGQVDTRHDRHVVDLIWAVAHELSRCPVILPPGGGEANRLTLESGASGASIIGTVAAPNLGVKGIAAGSSKVSVATDSNDVLIDVVPGSVDHNALLNYDPDEHFLQSEINVGNLPLARIAGSTYSTVQHLQDLFHSAGYISGGVISDGGSNTVDVSSGIGLIRATDSAVAELLYFDWAAATGLSVPPDTVRYIGIEYNSGIPQAVARNAHNSFDFTTAFKIGSVVNENGSIHIQYERHTVGDHASNMILRLYDTALFQRDERTKGLILGETGTRNVTLSAGNVWADLEKIAVAAIDTSAADTFDTYYRDGAGGWTEALAQTQWPNTEYDDDSGSLQTMANNRYANLWFYLELDGGFAMVYPQAQYVSESQAEAESPPSTLPRRLTAHGYLIGRIIFQKSGATAEAIETVFTTTFSGSGVTTHSALSLDDGTNPHGTTPADIGVEAGADVTDATNVEAAGAVMDFDYSAKGDVLVASAASTPVALGIGSVGQVLTVAAGTAAWAAPAAGGGDVTAAANMTATAILVGDDGAKGIKDTTILITGGNIITAVLSLDAAGLIGGSRFNSDVLTGTSPYSCASTTLNANLNAGLLQNLQTGTSGASIPRNDSSNVFSANTTVKVDNAAAFLVERADATDVFNVSTADNGHTTLNPHGTGEFKCQTNLDVTGNIVVSGTVDGRDVLADGTRLDNTVTRQANFEYVTPLTGGDFLLDGIPVGAKITECYAVCQAATEIKFGIVMRARATPWTAAGETIIVDIATEEATTTGATKTLASTTYTADKVLRVLTGAPAGSPGILAIGLKYTID